MTTVITAILILFGLAVVFGIILGYASVRFRVEGNPIVDQIDGLLPQTQCGQCGYPGCRPYAEAIANGDAINKCPPGGQSTIDALADLLDVEAVPLDAEHGEEQAKMVAFIREDECIGCTKCIQACPVDAILGAAKQMHTVITDECTGCDLCVEPCPVDCIDMIPIETTIANWKWPAPAEAPGLIATDRGRGELQQQEAH
ncbi:electron transport complex subunit RsxB [Marinobacterium weihaiense]|uniref:Ion-translocating oxidoreductase complex subunit B n=1 Tax=Marinobacterium weihaiense TaxID=2851016 RepID=A0ABS6M924_9GAMM|nr:electron transport complex subunit RsxB [Marinobacterium weihaiense]MBV0932791.1 electron transport complex subunit RsxB [Marinobacterium weihaiense]